MIIDSKESIDTFDLYDKLSIIYFKYFFIEEKKYEFYISFINILNRSIMH